MSARAHLPRKSASSTLSYADAHTSSSDAEDGESVSGGGAARGRKGRGSSKRAKGKAKALEGDEEEESDEDEAQRKKARKAAKGAGMGRKKGEGKLEVLKTLPVELLGEIFSHLDPNDLLALSMVNKQYRALLVAESSARLWKDARERLKIPAVTSGDYQEWQYASLIFGTRCQLCGGGKGVHAQAGLRVRFCNSCWTVKLVKPTEIKRTHAKDAAKLHPRASEVVLVSNDMAVLDDLYRATAILRDLEDQDEDSDIGEGRSEREPAPASSSATSSPFARHSRSSARRDRSTARWARTFSSNQWSSRQDESSDDDAPSPYSRRVEEYVAERRKVIDTLGEDRYTIRQAVRLAQKHLKEAKKAAHRDNEPWLLGSRSNILKQKVLALGLNYNQYNFFGSWLSSKLVNNGDANITEEEWATLKPKLLKLLERDKAKALEAKRFKNQSTRQSALRPRYDRLKASLPESARPYVPLFVDFLLLPSVKTLWENDEDEDDTQSTAWDDKLDEIREELEQFRVDLLVYTGERILEATLDPDKRGSNDDGEDGALGADGDNLDGFFARATSFVCCDAKDCRVRRQRERWRRVNGRYQRDNTPRADLRLGAVGPLADVLAHLHAQHNGANSIVEKRRAKGEPQFHVALPLEVACAVGALPEVNELDEATAGVKELDHADIAVKAYEWENRTSTHRRFAAGDGRRAWFDLLFTIKLQGAKLARMKPPVFLDPPVIVLHKLKYPRAGYDDGAVGAGGADEDEDEEEMSVMSGEESE
ncbi:hypothetical protein JCM10449v2_006473 [Rhodotorula kratochvilovae]